MKLETLDKMIDYLEQRMMHGNVRHKRAKPPQ